MSETSRLYSEAMTQAWDSVAHSLHRGYGLEVLNTCKTCNPDGWRQARDEDNKERQARRERERHDNCPTCTCGEDDL